jgi:precorrin-6A/cobalt-precorrin-6A reductase
VRILILAGTSEARALAAACADRGDLEVISSLAGRTRAPQAPPGEVRVGGFGGAAGLERFLKARAIDRVVDASHPFASQIGRHAHAACAAAGVPRLRLLRPPWRRQRGDRWHEVADLAEAAARLPGLGARALLTVGQKDLAAFVRLQGVSLLIRTIEPPTGPLPAPAEWLQGRGPFTLESELELLRAHRIEVLVVKASGGEATYAKLAAARRLGLPVLMVRRPPPPPGPVVATVAEALAWLAAEVSSA